MYRRRAISSMSRSTASGLLSRRQERRRSVGSIPSRYFAQQLLSVFLQIYGGYYDRCDSGLSGHTRYISPYIREQDCWSVHACEHSFLIYVTVAGLEISRHSDMHRQYTIGVMQIHCDAKSRDLLLSFYIYVEFQREPKIVGYITVFNGHRRVIDGIFNKPENR